VRAVSAARTGTCREYPIEPVGAAADKVSICPKVRLFDIRGGTISCASADGDRRFHIVRIGRTATRSEQRVCNLEFTRR
jgi:hypothetical protein